MSSEPFQDLVAKVEAEPDTRRKIFIVREYDVKRNGTKVNQIKTLEAKLTESQKEVEAISLSFMMEKDDRKSALSALAEEKKAREEAEAEIERLMGLIRGMKI